MEQRFRRQNPLSARSFFSRWTIQRPCLILFALLGVAGFLPLNSFAQQGQIPKLEKWPEDLETAFALSALPGRLRAEATIYLLDPDKGYVETKKGSNGFTCFVLRTEWERSNFRNDLATAIAFDKAGTSAIFSVFRDVAALRAVQKYSAAKIKSIVERRFKNGSYKEPGRAGLSYMLAPLMRSFPGPLGDTAVATFSAPHYMTYAPHVNNRDIGGDTVGSGPMVLGDGLSPHGYIMFPLGKMEKAQLLSENDALLKRLALFKPYFSLPASSMPHH